MHLVPGRATSTGLTWWLLTAPDAAPSATLAGGDGVVVLHRLEEIRSGDPKLSGDVYAVAATGLAPDKAYRLQVDVDGAQKSCRSRTLPSAVEGGKPFTIALGSCYSLPTHQGLGWWYPPDKHKKQADPVRLRFLCGDQIYMDLAPSDGHVVLERPQANERYVHQWRSKHFHPFLKWSPSIMLADDHEYWNNYPHKPLWLTWAEDAPGGPVGRSMDRAFSTFQSAMNLDPADLAAHAGNGAAVRRMLGNRARSFSFEVEPLSFFVLDTRSRRTRSDADEPHFCKPAWLSQAVAWLSGLQGPGVLVMAQTLVEKPTGSVIDAGLPDFKTDFQALCDAIFAAEHDVVVLCGDIHWSRHRTLRRGSGTGPTVHEVVSSPLSRIPKLPFENLRKTYPGDESGKFRWGPGPARVADWELGAYRCSVTATYATLSFKVGNAGGVTVRLDAWGHRFGANRAVSISGESFLLR